jgi:hypothetical protein
MQHTITTIFCYVDDFLKALSWKDDPQCCLSLSEIVTIIFVSRAEVSTQLNRENTFGCDELSPGKKGELVDL